MAPAFSAHIAALRRGALCGRWVPAAMFSSGILAGDKPILVKAEPFFVSGHSEISLQRLPRRL